jgi:hypothetical protein
VACHPSLPTVTARARRPVHGAGGYLAVLLTAHD